MFEKIITFDLCTLKNNNNINNSNNSNNNKEKWLNANHRFEAYKIM